MDPEVGVKMDWARIWLALGSGTPIFFLCPGEDGSDLIRHFLIESSAKGVHLKGADEEPYFGEPSPTPSKRPP
jgi:hypothetical protein